MNYEHPEKMLTFYRDNEKYFRDKKIYWNEVTPTQRWLKETEESYHEDRRSILVILNIFMFAYVAPFIIF